VNEGIITGDEILRNQYKARTEKYYRLAEGINDEKLSELITQWDKRAAKQLEVLHEIVFLSDIAPLVSKKEITDKFSGSSVVLKKLIEKNIIEEILVKKGRLEETPVQPEKEITLSRLQQLAFNAVQQSFHQHEVTLLHGVTSSGKTHIYIKLIEEMLQHKMQVLYLLPEIALTSQIIRKLKAYFGNKVGVYHSKFNPNERVEIWNKVLNEEYQVVLGVRSAIFLPFQHLGLIIVDEEHDGSYKQHDPAPRYHARDTAVMLGKLTDAKVLLGTATPSLESYQNVKEGKYGLVEMKERFLGIKMPEILVVSTKEARRKKQMQGDFSNTLNSGNR
jgi:primosomal protein N' (replication factor Y) (superfamily II helicase)